MSIDQADRIDVIGIDKISGTVILTVSDQWDWKEEHAHLAALQAKLNTYVRFIESGELNQAYPESVGRKPVIEIVLREPMPTAGSSFLHEVGALLSASGIEVRSRVLKE